MPFFEFMSSRTATSAEIEGDINMAQTQEGNDRALVVYKTPSSSPSKRSVSPSQQPEMSDNDSSITPFIQSKRQYCEVDESISLREKNRVMVAANKKLIQQQMALIQRAEEASQMAREAEEIARAARQAQKQQENELKVMQLAQEKFQQEMKEKYQSYFTKLMVSLHWSM
jgi:hypothetical protein